MSNYKAGQVIQGKSILLQNRNFYKWDNNHKVVQYRRQMKGTGEIDFGNLLYHSTLICVATDTLPLYEFVIKYVIKYVIIKWEKKSHHNHRRICVTLNLRNKFLELFVVLKTVFLKLMQILQEIIHYGEW